MVRRGVRPLVGGQDRIPLQEGGAAEAQEPGRQEEQARGPRS